jgi:putative DNA primase/helicase
MIEQIADRLDLHLGKGDVWTGTCPSCAYAKPTLTIKLIDGKLWISCTGGCSMVAVLRAIRGLGVELSEDQVHDEDPERARKQASAKRLWNSAMPSPGTLVETYLQHRGITLPVPEALRFVAHQRNWREDQVCPAMVACVRDATGEQSAVHITSLTPEGSKAPFKHSKLMLGPVGGNAVHLTPLDELGDALAIGEGIETCLSVAQLTSLPTWACLSAGGVQKVVLPERIRHVLIACDGDPVGRRYATKAAIRFEREGRRVRLRVPPPGQDFNDILLKRGANDG